MAQTAIDQTIWSSPNPINSLGETFDTVQNAIDDLEGDGGGGWVYVPVGTWSEALTIQDTEITLFGAGWGSVIDGGTTGVAVTIDSNNCVLRDLQVKTDVGGGNAYSGVDCNSAENVIILRIFVNGSDSHGIILDSATGGGRITGCYVYDPDNHGLDLWGDRAIVTGNYIQQCGSFGIDMNTNILNGAVSGNIINTTADDGIYISANAENQIVDGNRITAWTNEAIDDDSGTSTVGDNDTT